MRFVTHADLDQVLRSIQFSPRPTLEAQVVSRVRDLPPELPRLPILFIGLGLLLGLGLIGILIFFFWLGLLSL